MSSPCMVRLASYNIHGCVGRDGRFDPQRVAAVLKELSADVVALQEVQGADRGAAFLQVVQSATGLTPVPGHLYGISYLEGVNVLLTRFPVRAVRYLDLTVGRYSPREAIDADLQINDIGVRCIATHLGLRPKERHQQIQRLLLSMRGTKTHPVVLLGDINEWFTWGRPLRWLHAHFRKPPAIRSFPTGLPLFALDRIWVSHPGQVIEIQAHQSRTAKLASDHLPVVATVELRIAQADATD